MTGDLHPLTLTAASTSSHAVDQPRASAPTLRQRRRGRRRSRRLAFPLVPALVLALAPHPPQAVASAPPQPPPGLDLWAWITGGFQRHGPVGSVVVVALAVAGYALSQAQNIESARRLLGRDRQPVAPPAAPGDASRDSNSPPPPRTPHNLPQAPGSAVPLLGREAALARLARLLEAGSAPVVITGMDGVGKTALAFHHLRQRLDDTSGGVVVLDGQRPLAGLVEQLEQFALVHFDQQAPKELPPEGRLAWLYSHWPLPGPVVVLLDELRDPADLEAFGRGLPERFRLLVTRRPLFGVAQQRVTLDPLDDREAVALLAAAAERGPFPEGDQEWAIAVAREVGGLPLALWLLGRRLARDADLELADLRRRLVEKGALARDLREAATDPLRRRGLRAGFLLAWEGIGEAERELARLLGQLPPAAIPWDLLALGAPRGLDPDDWREARLGLEQEHLIGRPFPGMVSCHPLLHDLFAAEGDEGRQGQRRGLERRARLAEALRRWLPRVSDVLEARSRERSEACHPLLEALARWPADRWSAAVLGAGAAGLPLLALGRLRSAIGADQSAVEAFREGMERIRRAGGADAQRVLAGCLVGLAGIARERGQLEIAERQCRKALALLAAEEGPSPSQDAEGVLARADALNGLGLVLHELDAAEAESVLRQALELRQASLGDDDRLVQVTRNNLARHLARQGRVAEATALYRRALEALREEPCEVAMAVHNNLAFIAMDQGRPDEALAELREAVRVAVRALGEHHPRRGELLRNLAYVEEHRGLLRDAEAHYRQAFALMRAAWGEEDPRSQESQLTLKAFLDDHGR